MEERFIDENLTLSHFSNIIFVVCPQCNERAEVRTEECKNFKLVCEKCGLVRKKENPFYIYNRIRNDITEDIFETSLWLQKNYKGNVFWATNYKHLEYLKRYIQAKVRERKREPQINDIKNATMASRLPQFIKSNKNREGLLKVIEYLKEK